MIYNVLKVLLMIGWLVADCKSLPNTMIKEIEYDDDFTLSDDFSDDFAISGDFSEVQNDVELAFHVADGEALLHASGTVSFHESIECCG
jgi:hypothetical protein